MLELKKVTKIYEEGEDTQVVALDKVSLSFRKSEFVSVLGPSGGGKTTLLNIIGGLDRYTSGDLVIDGKSTKDFDDRDWDTYRNHRVGFVFQSYNLIPQQTVLSNVELALTLAGVSKKERRQRAIQALKDVGLNDQIYKHPSQLSGGQMQRVAIARALVSDPDILLADEPTGALDSKNSLQIMDLLTEIAKDRLVIMVTHNADLAHQYSSRIIELLDGRVVKDTRPHHSKSEVQEVERGEKRLRRRRRGLKGRFAKTHMDFGTALVLSFNNLRTKLGRTLLTAFAGSIGIIGIALILSLSNGVQNYIDDIEEDTLSSYPISLESSTMDTSDLLNAVSGLAGGQDYADGRVHATSYLQAMFSLLGNDSTSNNLAAFKTYIEENQAKFDEYANDIQYSYNIDLNIYHEDADGGYTQVNPDQVVDKLGMGQVSSMQEMIMGSSMAYAPFREMKNNQDLVREQYDILAGRLPESYDEVVLQVDANGNISDYSLYAIGLLDADELEESYQKMMAGEDVSYMSEELKDVSYSYDEILAARFKVLLNTDYYTKVAGVWIDNSENTEYMQGLLNDALELKVVGIVRPNSTTLSAQENYGSIWYTSDLTRYVVERVDDTQIAQEQLANPEVNVFTGLPFSNGEFKIEDLSAEQMAYLSSLDATSLAELIADYQENANATYESNLEKLGVVDLNDPAVISLYASSFDNKEALADLISEYNDSVDEADKISYTDTVAVMISGVTSIIDVISAVLIAFVSISLVVSSIMIGIITYISVLERTKEIGILRAIGASKRDVSRVFNAETLIIGLVAGVLGIVVTILLDLLANPIIESITGVGGLASLPVLGAVVLVLISVFLTMFAGLIPAKIASRKNPVEALRSE